jgi:polysaccharide biosynthesis/export protein
MGRWCHHLRWAWLGFVVAVTGCAGSRSVVLPPAGAYHERERVAFNEYVIDPPDILTIELLNPVPKPPYLIQPYDALAVAVAGTPKDDPINDVFQVDPAGTVSLGRLYGAVEVVGLTTAEAKAAIEKHLTGLLVNPKATVQPVQTRGAQPVRGQHLVRPDGHVALGGYGSVPVAGLTLTQAKAVIEAKLGETLLNPVVAVDVAGYNSKTFYVIFDFGGAGQQIRQLPVMGNETVLDAMAQMNGLSTVSDPARMFVARSTCDGEPDQILPVDWCGVTQRGRAETNYRLLPGDRVYVQAYPLVSADVRLARLLSPIERLFGVTLLGSSTIQQVRAIGQSNGTGVTGIIR